MPEPDGVPRERMDPAGEVDGPYVGLRPFRESQRHLIFGRDRDAQLLRQKLYSARLTLLYAPSGVGKTSLLSALVIPSLEADREGEEGSVVVSFEQWQEIDPLAALKARIAGAAGMAATGPADDLAQLLVAAQRSRGRSIVLVLDQFEQLLIRHPEQVDAIGRELGHALQLADRCHIVLSLREEFLASLHPLREHIPALMRSTYRLEHLAGDSARAAITEPAARFGAEVEEALLNTLIEDLRADVRGAAGVLTVPPPGAVELPFLQLICKTLWERSDRRVLTLDLYRAKLGGRGGIIQVYLNEVLAGLSTAEQDQAASVLHRLAPQSGVKKLYVTDELASETGLPAATVSTLLDHFARHSVLRTRDTGGATGYELHHDAFTAVLRPWIDARLAASARRARALRRVRIGSAALLVAGLAAVFVWPMIQARIRVNDSIKRATGSFAQGDEPAAQTAWTNLAGYLVGRNETEKLLRLLRDNRQLVPRRGTSKDLAEVLPEALVAEQAIEKPDEQPQGSSSASVVVSFGTERPLDLVGLHYAWRVGASRLLANSGLPVPIRIDVRRANLKVNQFTVRRRGASEKETLTLTVPSRPDHIILIDDDVRLPAARDALALLRRTNAADVEEVLAGGTKPQGWYVPYWTMPLWSALGVRTWPEEFGVALAINARVQAEPGVLLDQEAVQYLLNRARVRFCETVAEAESARGGAQRIRADLIALLKSGRSIGDLPDVLDALAAFPATESSDSVARSLSGAAEAAAMPRTSIPRWERRNPCGLDEMPPVPERFRDLLFPRMETEVQVTFGSDLFRAFDSAWTRSRREYRQAATGIRKNIYNGVGVDPPEVAPPKPDRELASRQFSILLPGRARQRLLGDVPADVQPDQVTGVVAPLLQKAMDASVASFIKAEAVATAIDELPEQLKTWLQKTYSLTDLKLLLRAFLATAPPETGAQTPERTLSELPWLLGSLAFWSTACGAREQACLIEGLASAQRARIAAAGRRDASPGVSVPVDAVSTGILKVREGEMGKAVATFKSAIARNRAAAAAAYTTEWAQLARTIQGYQLTRPLAGDIPPLCQAPNADPEQNPAVTLRAAWEIENYLDRRQPGAGGEEQDPVTLGLCLLRSHIANEDRAGSEAAWQRLTRDAPDLGAWPPAAQFLAGRVLFDAVRLEIIEDKHLADSQRLLTAALAKSKEDEQLQTMAGLIGICRDQWHTPRCVEHVRAIEAGVSRSFSLPFLLGVELSVMAESPADAEAALQLIAKAESLFPPSGIKEEQQRLRAWMLYARAGAAAQLARDHPEQAGVSRGLYRKLLAGLSRPEKAQWPTREDAYFSLLLLDVFEGHPANAQGVFDEWRKDARNAAARNTATFRIAQAFLMVERGDDQGLKDYARDVASETTEVDPENLFVASVAAILTNSLDASNEAMVRRFLDSDHLNRDVVRLVFYWRLKSQGQNDAAQALLDWRWSRLDPGSWQRRLERGESDAWPEMLVAYFHGFLRREQIFEGLDNEGRYRSTPIGRTNHSYSTTLSEAHFYDALLQDTQGDVATRKARMKRELEEVIKTRDIRNWEYYLAKYLLHSIGS